MKKRPLKHAVFDFGHARNSDAILAAGGPDTTGWRRAMDTSGANHALKRHGKGSAGWAKGSRLTQADFARIPEVVSKAHSVEVYGRGDATRIKYKADLNGRRYTYIETAGSKRQTLTFKSMWWKK